ILSYTSSGKAIYLNVQQGVITKVFIMETIENCVDAAIAELRTNIKDIIHEDSLYGDEFYLLRWLKVSNMKVKKAEKYLRSTAKWRKELDVSSMYNGSFPDGWLESMPIYADAVTNSGSLAASVQAGLVDIRGILEERGRANVVKLLVQAFVQAERVLVELNRNRFGGEFLTENSVEGGTMILDMNNFQARHLGSLQVLQTVGEVCKIIVKYFPVLGARIIVLNCNSFATVILKIIRSILESPSLVFEVYGQDKSEWQDSITSQIPSHLIRDVFGGTRPTEEKIRRDTLVDTRALLSYARDLQRISTD
ncbi:unnamed protein product, partial [Allacma fusca]